MAWAPVARLRRVLGARLHLLQVQYKAAARAADLQPAIQSLDSASAQSRAQLEEATIAQREQVAELQAAVAELRDTIAELSDRQDKQLRLSRAQYDDLVGLPETFQPKLGVRTQSQSGIRAVEPVQRSWETH